MFLKYHFFFSNNSLKFIKILINFTFFVRFPKHLGIRVPEKNSPDTTVFFSFLREDSYFNSWKSPFWLSLWVFFSQGVFKISFFFSNSLLKFNKILINFIFFVRFTKHLGIRLSEKKKILTLRNFILHFLCGTLSLAYESHNFCCLSGWFLPRVYFLIFFSNNLFKKINILYFFSLDLRKSLGIRVTEKKVLILLNFIIQLLWGTLSVTHKSHNLAVCLSNFFPVCF